MAVSKCVLASPRLARVMRWSTSSARNPVTPGPMDFLRRTPAPTRSSRAFPADVREVENIVATTDPVSMTPLRGEANVLDMSLWVAPDMNLAVFERVEEFVSVASAQLKALWAKPGDELGYLPLVQHLGDTACVAAVLWDEWLAASVKVSLAEKSGIAEADLRTLLLFLAGTHDVGKATLRFARQLEHEERGRLIADDIAATGLPMEMSNLEGKSRCFQHGLVGELLVKDWLQKRGCPKMVAGALGAVVGAHHGVATSGDDRKQAAKILRRYPAAWSALQQEILTGMAQVTGVDDVISGLPRRLHADVTLRLTGLVVMADWIASNQDGFPMVASGSQSERVRVGFAAVDLTRPWTAAFSADEGSDALYRRVFGWPDHFGARPIQKAALEAVSGVHGACMLIVEAPTGEGKTEAALAVGQRIAATTRSQGLLIAAPTMGTANGLFHRVVDWAARNTPENTVTSMNLVHSRKMLSEDFEKLRMGGVGTDTDDGYGTVVASQWMQGTKKAMLSDFVVATVDQVLMMALQMRHSMLRHIGLAGKVIIVDEAHAYDLYMQSYLQAALRWLARYGVSVVLLSATLPKETKKALVEAYGGEWQDTFPDELSEAYPLITVVDGTGVREIEVESRPIDIEASIELIPDGVDDLRGLVEKLTDQGGCVLLICNTVRRAQDAYAEIAQAFPGEVELHHSAFIASDRAFKEDRLREALGPAARRSDGRPYRRIICATQVAEQSLDIDADALITDIAPMDLLIQRIGRMHRHRRPAEDRPAALREPQVYVRGLLSTDPVPIFDGGCAAVYEPAILMSTLANLPHTFRRPDDVSALVQHTYSPDFIPPSAWTEKYAEAKAQLKMNQGTAEGRARAFQLPEPMYADKLEKLFERYHRNMSEKTPTGEEAGAAQVRDTDLTIETIPIIDTDYGYRPMPTPDGDDRDIELVDGDVPDRVTAFQLASSVLRLPARLTRFPSDFDAVIDQLEKQTPEGWMGHFLVKGQVALRLNEAGETQLNGHQLRYSADLGLEVVSGKKPQKQ